MPAEYAKPSRELKKLWNEWIALHKVLAKGQARPLAAPFFSAVSNKKCDKRILLVGKATDKKWELESYKKALRMSNDDAIDERLSLNRSILKEKCRGSAFCRLLKRVVKEISADDYDGVVWSNVAKIGVQTGNPKGLILSAQSELSERTLRAEIQEYNPVLVIFVTDTFGTDIITNITKSMGISWCISETDENVWFCNGAPAFLWTMHPQGKNTELTAYWINVAKELIKY